MLKKTLSLSAVLLSATLALSTSHVSVADAQTNYIGEIRAMGYNFCPRGWIDAQGQLLAINQYEALYSLYGTTFGGDGRTTFGIPQMRGRSAIGYGQGAGLSNYRWGQKSGGEYFTLDSNNLPTHAHTGAVHKHVLPAHGHSAVLRASSAAPTLPHPKDNSLADWTGVNPVYAAGQADGDYLSSQSIEVKDQVASGTDDSEIKNTGNAGAQRALPFRSPYLAVKYCVCLTDCIFPSRS
jgi:microcystin-dependent protein